MIKRPTIWPKAYMIESIFNHYIYFRLSCAFFSGALMTLSGIQIQSALQNSLASPSTLGMIGVIVTCISVTYVLALIEPGIIIVDYQVTTILVFSLLVFIFILIQKNKKFTLKYSDFNFGEHQERYILIGIGLNLLVGAVFSILQFYFMAFNRDFPQQIWFGHFKNVSTLAVLVTFFSFLILYFWSLKQTKNLWALSFGGLFAFSLGLNAKRILRETLLRSLICSAVVTIFYGVFAFVGLVFPAIIRMLFLKHQSFKREIILSPIIGGLIFVFIDYFSYSMTIEGVEIPAGLLTALFGTVFLVLTLLKSRNEETS